MDAAYISHLGPSGGYLVAHSFQHSFQEEWFDPSFWGENAVPVVRGGRGAAWFITRDSEDLVLRQFRRGGVPGRFFRRDYIYTRVDAVRSFAEFRLLNKLHSKGLPVPEPVAAGFRHNGPFFYHASIILRRIPGARSLSEFDSVEHIDVWREAGACIRRFHNAGVFHADLNCTNVMVSDQVYLIDFDRGRMMSERRGDNWMASNISRLKRSVNKCLGSIDSHQREELWQALLDSYNNKSQ